MCQNIQDLGRRAAILTEALPYLQKFSGKVIVVKYGGAAMVSEALKRAIISDIVLLSLASIKVVLVHGGGPEINALLDKIGKEPRFIGGLRYTDDETMEIVQMVLSGKIGKNLAGLAQELGGSALSLCGIDGGMIRAEKLAGETDYGLVGDITRVDPAIIEMALANGHIPIVSTVALGEGGGVYNLNADTAASALAVALRAEKLILLTDVAGILTDPADPTTLLSSLGLSEIDSLCASGVIKGGMIPKVECCAGALRQGVPEAHILDGRLEHSVLLELLSDSGVGTMIVKD